MVDPRHSRLWVVAPWPSFKLFARHLGESPSRWAQKSVYALQLPHCPVLPTILCSSSLARAIPMVQKPCAHKGSVSQARCDSGQGFVCMMCISCADHVSRFLSGLSQLMVFPLDGVPRNPVQGGWEVHRHCSILLHASFSTPLVHFPNFLFQMPATNRGSSHAYERRQQSMYVCICVHLCMRVHVYICVCVYVCVHIYAVCACVCICVCAHVFVYVGTRMCMCTCIHVYICICKWICGCTWAYVYVFVCACAGMCTCALCMCICACVYMCMCMCMHVDTCMCVNAWIHVHTRVHTCAYEHTRTHMCTCARACVYTCIYAHVHICVCMSVCV